MSTEKLKSDIEKKEFRKIYYICGDENYLKRFYLGQIKSCFSEDTDERDGRNLDPSELSDMLSSVSFFSEKRLIIIRDLPLNAPSAAFLTEHPDELNDGVTVVIFNVSEAPDERLVAFKKLKAVIEENGLYVKISALDSSTLLRWVCQQCKKHGSGISASNAEYFISQTEKNMDFMLCEISKLSSYCFGREISRDDIDLLCVKTAESRTYELCDALLDRDSDRAFLVLGNLINMRTNEILILSSVCGAIANLYKIHLLYSQGLTAGEISAETGAKEFTVERNIRRLRGIDAKKLRKLLLLCGKADIDSKTTSVDVRAVLTQLMSEIMSTV